MKTKAAILVEQNQPLVVDEVVIPSLSYGQVLVEVAVSRICGSQIGEIAGVKGPDRYLPHLLGHEGGGIVREIGPEVKSVKPGDRVVMHWRPGAGIEGSPPVYGWEDRKANAGNVTTFNEYAVVSENRLTPIPDSINFDTAALLADTLTTGFGIINNDAQVRIVESVVIIGCGGIGLGVVLGARLAGAHPIIAVDLIDRKLTKAKIYGATHTINSSDSGFLEGAKLIAGEYGADVVIDGTGNPDVIATAYALTQPKGRCILFGVMRHDARAVIHTLPLHFGKVLKGSEGGGSRPHLDIPRYVRLIEEGMFDPAGFISHRITLEEVNTGIEWMKAGEVIHCLIDFEV